MKLSNVGQSQNLAFGSRFTQIAELVKEQKVQIEGPDIKIEAIRIINFAEKIHKDGKNLTISLMKEPYKDKEAISANVYDESRETLAEKFLGKVFSGEDNEGEFGTIISRKKLEGLYKNAVDLYKQSLVKPVLVDGMEAASNGQTAPKNLLGRIKLGLGIIKKNVMEILTSDGW